MSAVVLEVFLNIWLFVVWLFEKGGMGGIPPSTQKFLILGVIPVIPSAPPRHSRLDRESRGKATAPFLDTRFRGYDGKEAGMTVSGRV